MNARMVDEVHAPPLDPWHEIDLKDGHFKNTSAEDLKAAFKKFEDESGGAHLSVFFHGGLVGYNAGLEAATKLLKVYDAGGTYPFFFIWRSGLWQALADLIRKYEKDPAFVKAANGAFDLVAAKMAVALADPGLTRRIARGRGKGGVRTLKQLAALSEPYDRAWEKRDNVQLSCTSSELKRFEDFLVKPGKGRRSEGATFRAANIRGARDPLYRIIHRLNTHHDHGLYTTIVEETLIAIGVDVLARGIWDEMKSYIDDSFKNEATAGGTVFLSQLATAWRKNSNLRVTLLAHSAGSIYVQRFIEELDARFPDSPDWKVEVLYMAPAVSMARMFAGLGAFRRRVRAFRMFTLNGKAEHKYFEVPVIYKGSLLYIVSGLCEGDPNADKPILGMQRYWSGKPPYHGADLAAVIRAADPTRIAWCPTDMKKPGWQCGATQHGGFPLDGEMEDSARYVLEHGFA